MKERKDKLLVGGRSLKDVWHLFQTLKGSVDIMNTSVEWRESFPKKTKLMLLSKGQTTNLGGGMTIKRCLGLILHLQS
jgi:hypothetical protein